MYIWFSTILQFMVSSKIEAAEIARRKKLLPRSRGLKSYTSIQKNIHDEKPFNMVSLWHVIGFHFANIHWVTLAKLCRHLLWIVKWSTLFDIYYIPHFIQLFLSLINLLLVPASSVYFKLLGILPILIISITIRHITRFLMLLPHF